MDPHSNPYPGGTYLAVRWIQDQLAREAFEVKCRDEMWKPILASINPPADAQSYRPIYKAAEICKPASTSMNYPAADPSYTSFKAAGKSGSLGSGGHMALVAFLLFVLIAAVA